MFVKSNCREPLTKPSDVVGILRESLKKDYRTDRDKEHFWVIATDGRNKVKYIELVSLGTMNASLVHPREVFRTAIFRATAGIILGHNHPSGDCTPSEDDIEITKRLVEAGKIIGIEILDHVIINIKNDYLSFKEKGLI